MNDVAAATGRRPGKQDTREAILAAARQAFAERGFDGATIRGDRGQRRSGPGAGAPLLRHQGAAVPRDHQRPGPSRTTWSPEVFGGGTAELGGTAGARVPAGVGPPAGAAGVALLRSAVASERGARLMREFVITQLLRRAMRQLAVDPAEAPTRAALVASQMAGLAVARYLLRIEPLASAPADTVVALIAPTLQRYLTGPLPPTPGAGP